MKVVIIGSGNVASVLGNKLKNSGHDIVEVVARDKNKANDLATRLNAQPVYNVNAITSLADIYVIAVTDNAIQQIADQLKVNDKIVVHTSAAQPMHLLSFCSDRIGIVYPLQTIKKGLESDPEIPVIIDGNDKSVIEDLQHFCSNWASSITVANDAKRLKIHVAAVFVNNFTNHLLAVAKKYCEQNNIDFQLLYPLIKQTFMSVSNSSPETLQTGPAIRNDTTTLEMHRQQLVENESVLSLYNHLTESIQEFYHK